MNKTKILLFIGLVLVTFTVQAQNALNFDGVNDRVDCGNGTQVQLSGTQITLEAWVRPTAFQNEVWKNNIIDKEVWTPQQGYMLRCGAGGKLNFNLGAGIGWNELTSATTVLTLNTWTHVAGTYDGSYMRIYVNGICTDSIAKNITFVDASTANLVIGDNSQTGRNFSGDIDEVRVWSVARSKSEINASMNSEICNGLTGLVAYYRFNQGTAGGSNAGLTSVTNSAAAGTNGVLSGFALSGTTSNWVTGQTLTGTQNFGGDTIYDSFCSGTPYVFGSQSINQAGTYVETFYTAGGCDSTVTLILSQNQSAYYTYLDEFCQGGSYSFNGQTINQPGTYTDTLSTINGCDSIVNVILSITSVNVGITKVMNGTSLKADANNAVYQWLDCDNNFAQVPNATNQVFAPTTKGNYACIVTQNGCSDTSICMLVDQIISIQNSSTMLMEIFPNPTEDYIHINFSDLVGNKKITIYNQLGQEVSTLIHQESNIKLNATHLPKGLYFIEITHTKGRDIQRVILK